MFEKFMIKIDAGNGGLVRLLRRYGVETWGIELSKAEIEMDAKDLLANGWIEAATLTNIPYQDSQFDLVISGDVLEHISPAEAEQVVSEIVRVSKRHIFLSISQKGSRILIKNQKASIHTLLRPRRWWEDLFLKHGVCVNRRMVWAMQSFLPR